MRDRDLFAWAEEACGWRVPDDVKPGVSVSIAAGDDAVLHVTYAVSADADTAPTRITQTWCFRTAHDVAYVIREVEATIDKITRGDASMVRPHDWRQLVYQRSWRLSSQYTTLTGRVLCDVVVRGDYVLAAVKFSKHLRRGYVSRFVSETVRVRGQGPGIVRAVLEAENRSGYVEIDIELDDGDRGDYADLISIRPVEQPA